MFCNSQLRKRAWEQDKLEPVASQQPANKRFKFVTESTVENFSHGVIPKNTEKNNKWANNIFKSWREERNKVFPPEEQVPDDLLSSGDPESLGYWLSRFILEVRKKGDHAEYPPKTLHLILCGLQRIIRQNNPEINIFDKTYKHLARFRNVRDSEYHRLHTKGIGASVKHCEVFTTQDEQRLWESGIIGLHSPLALLRAAFILNGKNFCLRGGEEQFSLKISQFKRGFDPELSKSYYTYIENGSKNRRGSDLHLKNKTPKQFSQPELGIRCHVHVLDVYFRMVPPGSEQFYRKPLESPTTHQWFGVEPCSKNFLENVVKGCALEAGISKGLTNHSLRAGGATALFQSGVPEKLIAERTGHRSERALRMYERKTTADEDKVSKALSGLLMDNSSYFFQQQSTLPQLQVDDIERILQNLAIEGYEWITKNLIDELFSEF